MGKVIATVELFKDGSKRVVNQRSEANFWRLKGWLAAGETPPEVLEDEDDAEDDEDDDTEDDED